MKAHAMRGVVVALAVAMVGSMLLGVVPAAIASGSSVATATTASASTAAASTSAPVATASAPAATTEASVLPAATVHAQGKDGPHPGTLEVDEILAGGAHTMDPAIAYDTGSYEPILNVYQTLINYNGTSTDTYVPTLATCVPGTEQCQKDYGSTLVKNVDGQPIYWTFVIDPAAKFYDPHTGKSWSVYPSDVMFSISRTLAFANLPYATKNPGWIIGQALLPTPTAKGGAWDGGIHSGFPGYDMNNTPGDILGSMIVNDSAYCPEVGGAFVGNGCITFNASGAGHDWPFFLELAADNLGASVVPCGWFTAQDAGIPGWAGTKAANGDGPCKLPDGGTSTNNTAWSTYLSGLLSTAPGAHNATSWDAFEELAITSPEVQTGVMWSMVGSGPYYGIVTKGIGYELRANPAYAQPSGCSGAGGLATYLDSYCDPAAGASNYIPNVDVNWDPDDSFGISEYESGQADLAAIASTDTSTLLQLAAEGDLDWNVTKTISDFFTPINLDFSSSNYATEFAAEPTPSIPAEFFQNYGVREFLVHSYPYQTVEQTVRTVDGVQYTFNAGGPIPIGMGNYYPSNVSFPAGNPSTDATNVSGAAWWWAKISTPGNEYYDPAIAHCTVGSPCTWPITGLIGDPGDDIAIGDWINDISSLSGGRLVPFTFDVTFDTVLSDFLVKGGQNPVISFVGTGWAPDYPDPTDYVAPEVQPESSYTEPDDFAEALGWGKAAVANNTTCGHNALTPATTALKNLDYWAHAAANPSATSPLNNTCQGVAYTVASAFMQTAALLPVGPQRILDYNLIEQITNALSMVIWNGQSNTVSSWAPWIDGSTLNNNPMIGGGGDEVWFQVRYNAGDSNVSFAETGLPATTHWSATLGTTTVSSTSTYANFTGLTTGTFPYTIGFVPGYKVTPSASSVSITKQENVTVTLTFTPLATPTYSVSFSEVGLVSNTTWANQIVDVGALASQGPTVTFQLPNGAYTYTPGVPGGYRDAPVGSGAFSGGFTVAGANLSIQVNYTSNILPVYNVTFAASGLPAGLNWSVQIAPSGPAVAGEAKPFTLTSNTSTIVFGENNANYTATFTAPTGYTAAAPSSGILLHEANETITVPFVAIAAAHQLTFGVTGLPKGTDWNITLLPQNLRVESDQLDLNLSLALGAYDWRVSTVGGYWTPTFHGTATVVAVTAPVNIAFSVYTFGVTFVETGLPVGKSWNVTISSALTSSSTQFLSVNLANGSWAYTVGVPAAYMVSPGATGKVTVANGTVTEVLVFSVIPETFAVTFKETGLSGSTPWTVYFDGTSKSAAAGTSISFAVANGTWSYGFSGISGYTANATAGTVTVNGATKTVTVGFSPTSTSSSKPSSTYLSTLAYEVIGGIAALAVIGFILAAVFAGRRPPATPPKGWSEKETGSSGSPDGEEAPMDTDPKSGGDADI